MGAIHHTASIAGNSVPFSRSGQKVPLCVRGSKRCQQFQCGFGRFVLVPTILWEEGHCLHTDTDFELDFPMFACPVGLTFGESWCSL